GFSLATDVICLCSDLGVEAYKVDAARTSLL
ncbi:hypothetical protein L195_g027729, partial [Trifolium pratense]